MMQSKEFERPGEILNMLKESRLYWSIRKEVFSQMLKNRKDGWEPTKQELLKIMSMQGFHEQLRCAAQNCANRTAKRIPLEKDGIPQVQTVKLKWSENIIRAFRTVTNKLRKDEEDEEEDESVNYVYDAASLLEFLGSIKIKSSPRIRQHECYMFQHEIMKVPRFSQIKQRFDFFSSENINGRDRDGMFYRDRERKATKLIESELMESQIQRFLLLGSTNGQRVQLYTKYFQIQEDLRLVSSLIDEIEKKNNPFDSIVIADVSEILNDERYFVFKEEIRKLIKMFVRDRSIQQKVKIRPHVFSGLEVEVAKQEIPLSQILPCKMLSKYIAPFCYASLRLQTIYSVFREFYCNYFCLLHSISSEPSSILYLSLLFQQLLDSTERKLAHHLASLEIEPLKLVFNWIFYCYIGFVDIEQVFYIFDRIVAMKSLEILSLYAVALLFKQRSALMEAKSQAEVEEILEDTTKLDNVADTIKHYLAYHL